MEGMLPGGVTTEVNDLGQDLDPPIFAETL
jgi:hypothetical protein